MPKSKPKPRYGGYEGGNVKDERLLGQTIDYEGGLENSHSRGHNASGMLRSSEDEDLVRPIYDSKEDPIPKAKKVGGGNKANVLLSGDSFGGKGINPLNRSSGNVQERFKNQEKNVHRDQIDEDFLNEDDDVQESGELNPSMFRWSAM